MTPEMKQMMQEFFTEEQWEAIASALKDYGDYGDEETEIADEIDTKIYKLFRD
jgi:hypothetical protein